MNHSDRCDHGNCGAQAFIRVASEKTGRVLDFCVHHYNELEMFLGLQGMTIAEDNRALLNEKPSVSANV